MKEIIILTPNEKFTDKDIELSENSKKELENLKKELNLPDSADTMRV